jgi:hypothetical protein
MRQAFERRETTRQAAFVVQRRKIRGICFVRFGECREREHRGDEPSVAHRSFLEKN